MGQICPIGIKIGIQGGWSASAENWTFCDARIESVCAWKSEPASLQREKEETDRQRGLQSGLSSWLPVAGSAEAWLCPRLQCAR